MGVPIRASSDDTVVPSGTVHPQTVVFRRDQHPSTFVPEWWECRHSLHPGIYVSRPTVSHSKTEERRTRDVSVVVVVGCVSSCCYSCSVLFVVAAVVAWRRR